MERSDVVDFEYVAIEPRYNRIRLARQPRNNADEVSCAFVIGILDDLFYSAPYGVVLASGELYNADMDTMTINEMELLWLRSLSSLVSELE